MLLRSRKTIMKNSVRHLSRPSDLASGHPVQSDFADTPQVLSINAIDFRLARSRRDLTGAFELLQRRYAEAGLSADRSAELRVLPYHLWRETQIFVAVHRGKVIGSVSLTRDGNDSGIPMESTYGDVVERLRRERQSFGEVCSLTVDSPGDRSTGEIFGQLTRMIMFFSRHIGLDQLVAVVHPRHAKFYQRAMGFDTIGGPTQYHQVAGQPGIPILGSVNNRDRYRRRWQQFYFDGCYAKGVLDPSPLSFADVNYFRQYLPSTPESAKIRRTA